MNTAVTRNDWVGRVIDGRFPLLEWLGSSEKAGVFRTELIEPKIRPAVIRILPADGENPEDRLRDWASAAKLSHPHLMSILQSGRAQVGGVDLLYVVTEYAEESLAQVIPERPLSNGEAGAMLAPILDALSYLHAQGFVHGHIKPANIMVVDNRLKLPIESVRPAGRLARPATSLAIYDPPEAASGSISPAADIWSLGITLVEALTQNAPSWDRSTNRDPHVPSELPHPFAAIARACLRYNPALRSSPRQIRELLTGQPPTAEPANEIDQAAPAAIKERTPSSPARKGTFLAAILVVIAVIAFFLLRSRPPQPAPPEAKPSVPEAAPPPASPSVPQPPAPSGVTAKGGVARRVMPDVVESANRTIRGTLHVRVRLRVDSDGAVAEASFDAPGPSRYYSAKALEAARKWQFKPPQVNGRDVPSIWMLHFEFRRSGPEVSAQQVSSPEAR